MLLATNLEVKRQIRHATPQAPDGYGTGCGCADSDDASSCRERAPSAAGDYTCPAIWHTENRSSLFVADAARFTMSIRHTVYQSLLGYEATSHSMRGWLQVGGSNYAALPPRNRARQDALCAATAGARVVSYNGTGALADRAPCLIPPLRTLGDVDYFELLTLLDAVGVDLDGEADGADQTASAVGGVDQTARRSGLVLLLSIVYSNSRPFFGLQSASDPENPAGISYLYKLSYLNDTAKESYTSWDGFPRRRLLFQKSGVLIYAQPSGVLAQFSFSVLLITITTSLAFLVVAKVRIHLRTPCCHELTCRLHRLLASARALAGDRQVLRRVPPAPAALLHCADVRALRRLQRPRRRADNAREDELRGTAQALPRAAPGERGWQISACDAPRRVPAA